MAIFYNQATLTYNGGSVDSNIAYGEIIDVLSVTKTAIEEGYGAGDTVTYVVTLQNTGSTALTGLTVTDDLGGYAFGTDTLYPLTYNDGSAVLFANGQVQPAPAVQAGPPLVVTGISVPAQGGSVLIYQATANEYANPAAGGSIVNTVTVTGDGISAPLTATETVTAVTAPVLTISKSISPSQVMENERVTYTFIIQNYGNEAIVATDNAVVTDAFDPILSDISVTYEGELWTQGVQYNYSEATGLFTTNVGQITLPAATVFQDPATGRYTVTPSTVTLTVTGTI